MIIGGLQKCSLIDYPGRIGAIVFTQGCNFRCPYCHNPELVDPKQYGPSLTDEVIPFLEKRRGKLDAVTVTGGEPTLQRDIGPFLREVRSMGYLIKLDTNGSLPDVPESLIFNGLIDYVAMDVKAPLEKYEKIAGLKVDTRKIRESIRLIVKSKIDHEFRTTVVRSQLDPDDLQTIAKLLGKAKLYVLQPFVGLKTLEKEFLGETSYSSEAFSAILKIMEGKRLRTILR